MTNSDDPGRQRRPRRAQSPGDGDQRDPAPRADPRQHRVRRHLEQHVAPEKGAGAEPVSRRRQPQRLVHRQRRDRDVEAVQHIDAVAKTEQWQKPHTPPCASRQLRGRAPSFPPAKLCWLCQHTQDRARNGQKATRATGGPCYCPRIGSWTDGAPQSPTKKPNSTGSAAARGHGGEGFHRLLYERLQATLEEYLRHARAVLTAPAAPGPERPKAD